MKKNSGFYVFKASLFKKNIEHIKEIFQTDDYSFQLNYSIKANYHHDLLEAAKDNKVVFDCASLKEIRLLKEVNPQPNTICVNTPYLTDDLLDCVLKDDLFLVADSFSQLSKISNKISSDKKIKIGLRISLDTIYSRFGIVATQEKIKQIHSFFQKHKHIELAALSMHYSPTDRSTVSFRKRIREFIKVFINDFTKYDIETLNFGGGFASAMSKEMADQFDYKVPSWKDYSNVLKEELKKENISNLKVVIEPGMGLVADVFDFVSEVIDIKQQGNKMLALLNTSTLFVKPTGHQKKLDVEVDTRSDHALSDQEYHLVGISCMENDILGTYNGTLQVGSKITFKNVGAYTLSYRNNFIFDQPKVYSI